MKAIPVDILYRWLTTPKRKGSEQFIYIEGKYLTSREEQILRLTGKEGKLAGSWSSKAANAAGAVTME